MKKGKRDNNGYFTFYAKASKAMNGFHVFVSCLDIRFMVSI